MSGDEHGGAGSQGEQSNPTRACGWNKTHCFDNLGESPPIREKHVAAADRPIRDGSTRKEGARERRGRDKRRSGEAAGYGKLISVFPPRAILERKCTALFYRWGLAGGIRCTVLSLSTITFPRISSVPLHFSAM